jgi:adenosylcobinamide-GDP ribazoletransferase
VLNEFWLALGFLTTLPTKMVAYQPDGLGRAGRWFPGVGLILGLLLAALYTLSVLWFTPAITSVLVIILWAGLTGGLHLDGLADCCDGLLASVPRERRLEIMRDPRVGAFGVIGLVLALLLKAAAVMALGNPLPALVLAPVWARWFILWAARQPPARPGGLGNAFAASLTPVILAQALILPLLVLATAFYVDWRSLLAVMVAGLAVSGVIRLAHARIGGVTGDVFGAVVELAEITILLVLAR